MTLAKQRDTGPPSASWGLQGNVFVCKLPLYFPRMGTCSKFKREKAKGVSLTLSGLEGAWESPTWGLMTVIMHDREL